MRNGFTLIELLIVIAIVAILAGAMVPMINVSRQTARDARARSDLDAIKTAAVMYNYDLGSWPFAGNTGNGLVNNTGVGDLANWNGPYLDDWTLDPWNTSYEMYTPGAPELRVRSLGADTAVGGTGANADIELIITSSGSW